MTRRVKTYILIAIAIVAIIAVRLLTGTIAVAAVPDKSYRWNLTGSEMLVELSGNGKMPGGIYAFDPAKGFQDPTLLVEGGSRPTWSLKRNYVAYLKEGLWIARKNGESYMICGLNSNGLGQYDPPIRWTWHEERYFMVFRSCSSGTMVCYGNLGLLPIRESDSPRDRFYPGTVSQPLFPFRERIDDPARQDTSPWSNIMAVRDMDVSPDGMCYAAEVAPQSPMDLRRNESKIYLFYPAEKSEDMERGWFYGTDFVKKPPKRLTQSDETTCELAPLWSPTGDWIAFTVVHFDKGYVAPAVCHPDGTGYLELLPEKAEVWPRSEEPWYPIAPLDVARASKEPKYPEFRWGNPSITPVEWSTDGKYLLLNQDNRFNGLSIAKFEEGKWLIGASSGIKSCSDVNPAGDRMTFASLAPPSLGMCRVATVVCNSIRIADKEKKHSLSTVSVPDGMTIKWMDW